MAIGRGPPHRQCAGQKQTGKQEHRDAVARQVASSEAEYSEICFSGPDRQIAIKMPTAASVARKARQLSGDSRSGSLHARRLFRLSQSASRKAPRQNRVAPRRGTYQSSDRHSSIHSRVDHMGASKDATRRIDMLQPFASSYVLDLLCCEPASPATDSASVRLPASFPRSA